MKGAVFGLTFAATKAHVVRAALESIAYQVKDLADVMAQATGGALTEICADGGPTRNAFLMQFQADISGTEICRPAILETTALGAACLAGLAVGVWENKEQLLQCRGEASRFSPAIDEARRQKLTAGFARAVERSRGWELE